MNSRNQMPVSKHRIWLGTGLKVAILVSEIIAAELFGGVRNCRSPLWAYCLTRAQDGAGGPKASSPLMCASTL